MYFANFNKLKIDTDYNYITHHFDLNLGKQPIPVKLIQSEVKRVLSEAEINKTEMCVLYDFSIAAEPDGSLEIDELVSFLLTLSNIIVPEVLQFLDTKQSYKRERRLDVPDKLKPLHTSYGMLKRACNSQLLTPVMNIKINFSNVSYIMCDGRDVDEIKEESSDE